jgi:putative DNA-invertase from lambdoid prophage Rac
VVLDPALDLSTPAGRIVATMLAAVAEMEAELVAERTAAIVEMKQEQGKSLGAADRLCRPRSSTASSGSGSRVAPFRRLRTT